jgi:hypothetical protein
MTDLTGQRFGRLLVLAPAHIGTDGKVRWRCRCDCGNETIVGSAYHLTSGNTSSCGCLRQDTARERHLLHGGKGSRLYNIWKNARQRCRNPKTPDYRWYGAKGVIFSSIWDDFDAFRRWSAENGYSPELTLDRIDPFGNYEPSNCRWVTWQEQAKNKRNSKKGVVA